MVITPLTSVKKEFSSDTLLGHGSLIHFKQMQKTAELCPAFGAVLFFIIVDDRIFFL